MKKIERMAEEYAEGRRIGDWGIFHLKSDLAVYALAEGYRNGIRRGIELCAERWVKSGMDFGGCEFNDLLKELEAADE